MAEENPTPTTSLMELPDNPTGGQLTLEIFQEEIEKHACYSFDIEHDPNTTFSAAGFDLWGISFAVGDRAWFITDRKLGIQLVQLAFSYDKTKDGRNVEAIAYNGKYDLKCLKTAGWLKLLHHNIHQYPAHFCDPMVAVNLLDDNRRPNQLGLDVVINDKYGYSMMQFKAASALGHKSALFRKYALDDATWELKLWNDIKPKLVKENLWDLFTKIIMPVCKPFADMEYIGIQWDLKKAKELLIGFMNLRDKLHTEVIAELGPINLKSGDQLAKRLFDEMGLSTKGIPMTKSGKRFAVDEAAMDILARKHPICKKIVSYRTAEKMIGTYVEPNTRKALDDPKGRIHPTIWVVSTTGRTRMDKPNFQNIPAFLDDVFKGLKIRSCVVPAPGKIMLAADLSQIELRLAAHITKDPTFLKAYRDWECTKCGATGTSINKILHSCPTCGAKETDKILKSCPICKRLHVEPIKDPETKRVIGCAVCLNLRKEEDAIIRGFWHGLDLHQMTADAVPALKGDRNRGKTSNFALIYLAGGYRMHQESPEMSVDEWELAIEQYMNKYVGIRQWHIWMDKIMREKGVITDVFGRKRRISRKDIAMSYKHSLNQFVNFPVQSSGVGLIQLALVKLYNKWVASGAWLDKIYFSNFVHDEIVVEVDPDFKEEAQADIQHYMENSVEFIVPIRTEIKEVKNWAEAKG